MQPDAPPLIAIACGGTGGHLFPGFAVGHELVARGAEVVLLVSPKDVDQQAVRTIHDMAVVTLPAVGLSLGAPVKFAAGCWSSFKVALNLFRKRCPAAVLAMGGFTSAPPVLAGRHLGARTYLHESNTIPGRSNRWISRFVDHAFIGFEQARPRLAARAVSVVGTPVRHSFQPGDAASARMALGLDPHRPVLLIMGGSQGALGINQLFTRCAATLAARLPEAQYLHLTGHAANEYERVKQLYAQAGLRAVVRTFLTEMELALTAATVAINRAGASSLAELAALRVPAILIPYPAAAENHQFFNARAYVEVGAARMLGQQQATPENLIDLATTLLTDAAARDRIIKALAQFHRPDAAPRIAEAILHDIPGFTLRVPEDPFDDEAAAFAVLRPRETVPAP